MSLESSLAVRGFRLLPWIMGPGAKDAAKILGCADLKFEPTYRVFHRGIFDGLMDIQPDGIVLIAIYSDRPGSGRLPEFVSELESAADENSADIRIASIWNRSLEAWFERRGYAIGVDDDKGRHALRLNCARIPQTL